MKVTAIETINLDEFPNVMWVQVHTDEGLVGLGETFYAVEPAIAHIHHGPPALCHASVQPGPRRNPEITTNRPAAVSPSASSSARRRVRTW